MANEQERVSTDVTTASSQVTENNSRTAPRRAIRRKQQRINRILKATSLRRPQMQVATERALRLGLSAARSDPAVVDRNDKLRMGNMCAQRLHIYSVQQLEDFILRFRAALEAFAALAEVTRVVPKGARKQSD